MGNKEIPALRLMSLLMVISPFYYQLPLKNISHFKSNMIERYDTGSCVHSMQITTSTSLSSEICQLRK